MRASRITFAVLLVILVVLMLSAPIGPMPGVFIGGTSTKAPERWTDTSSVHEIMLRVPGTLPRVVIIWVIEFDGELHVLGSRDSGWVKMIGAGSPVDKFKKPTDFGHLFCHRQHDSLRSQPKRLLYLVLCLRAHTIYPNRYRTGHRCDDACQIIRCIGVDLHVATLLPFAFSH